ncbi:hypothetical protein [Spirosoma oryzicola]|uniref:hypothetical protein n=1 Tax=Spirosoma oryzicola TaxID=2898794 RepID=UPI001E34CA3D|nr:hypothetical protein [Spirosoma oryzicola]UHG94966.1 hypothetical protein LQ777_30500 [Spirosoma oryzicola]
MILHVVSITPDQQDRDFSCYYDDPEQAYDFLLKVTELGHLFIKVEFVFNRGYYLLPLETLNQELVANPFLGLRQQWEQCLSQPAVSRGPLVSFHRRLVDSQQTYLTNLQETLQQTLILLETTHNYLGEGPRKDKLIQQCWMTIDRCHRSIAHHNTSPWGLRSAA